LEALLDDPKIELVVNLTTPQAHHSVSLAALKAGKHVYSEKPIAVEMEHGHELLAEAKSAGLMIGCAPDTVLGAGLQTARAVLDAGEIGDPVGAQAFMMGPGHESWHPDPSFYYKSGGGPLFDMGPYYLTALVNLFGPVKRVTGSARTTFETRTITSQPRAGEVVPVETPTHISAVLDFASGPVVHLTTSFDVQTHSMPFLEVYGSQGSLRLPDPNGFGGPVEVWKPETRQWQSVSVDRPYSENSRGLGALDLARAMQEGREPRASGQVALHVLETMHAVLASSRDGTHKNVATPCPRPDPMPTMEL
jgi:predicted dehydrogenase